jgi:adenine C2-methylase RlmN of 23S rRNA A2503 and tRNA A37
MAGRYDLSKEDLTRLLSEGHGQPRYRADQVWEGLYGHGLAPDELTTLPKALRGALAADPALAPSLATAHESATEGGDTVKWLWTLHDGRQVETVLMHYPGRSTVCVSSQAGCAMACGFCATGQAGFDRHLTTGEIVEQVVRARTAAAAKGRRLSFEWALIDGVNDRRSDAAELAAYARPLGAHVNLIPLNPTPGYPVLGTPPERVRAFRDLLVDLGVNATVRRNRGTSIDAACGQLRASVGTGPGTTPVAIGRLSD